MLVIFALSRRKTESGSDPEYFPYVAADRRLSQALASGTRHPLSTHSFRLSIGESLPT